MRYVTDQELAALDETGKQEWKQMKIHAYSAAAGGGYFTSPKLDEVTHLMMQCLRCQSHHLLESCSNCGSTNFAPTSSGIFCARCDRGFGTWSCSQCGTENPASKTLFGLEKKKSGCFIATAVYGSCDTPEVVSLRLFRDSVLMPSFVGSRLVGVYYRCSPPIAGVLRQHRMLNQFTRIALVDPVVRFANWWVHGR